MFVKTVFQRGLSRTPFCFLRCKKLALNQKFIRLSQNAIRNFSAAKLPTARQSVVELSRVFSEAGVSEPETSADYIVAHACGKKTMRQTRPNHPITEEVASHIEGMSKQRLKHQPVQYILGEWDFRELTLAMKPPVFIPRPETEELVGLMLRDPSVWTAQSFLEIGCGSGAISLSLLHQLKNCQGVALDQSEAACDLTNYNASLVGVEERVQVIKLNLTQDTAVGDGERFDFVVSNPPYIPSGDLLSLQPEIYRYEDMSALDGGPDGMDVIKVILCRAPHFLKPDGSLWLEVDSSHPPLIEKLLKQQAHLQLSYVDTHSDYLHRARFCHLRYQPSSQEACLR